MISVLGRGQRAPRYMNARSWRINRLGDMDLLAVGLLHDMTHECLGVLERALGRFRGSVGDFCACSMRWGCFLLGCYGSGALGGRYRKFDGLWQRLDDHIGNSDLSPMRSSNRLPGTAIVDFPINDNGVFCIFHVRIYLLTKCLCQYYTVFGNCRQAVHTSCGMMLVL